MRQGRCKRKTKETEISLTLVLDTKGSFTGTTGIGFLDHMLTLWAVHGNMALTVEMKGDLAVDTHHSVEDLAIVLGEALSQALGNKQGIARYGTFYCPMDEALVRCVIDFSGRPYLVFDVPLTVERIGTFETEMLREFMYALAVHSKCNLHLTKLYGTNNHHMVETAFKALGHAMKQAVAYTDRPDEVLATKGVL